MKGYYTDLVPFEPCFPQIGERYSFVPSDLQLAKHLKCSRIIILVGKIPSMSLGLVNI